MRINAIRMTPITVFRTKLNIDTSLIFSILHFEYFNAQSFVNEGADTYLQQSN